MSFDGASLSPRPERADSFGKDRPGVYVHLGRGEPACAWLAFEALSDLDVDVVATVGSQLDPAAAWSIGTECSSGTVRFRKSFVLIEWTLLSFTPAGTVIDAATGRSSPARGHPIAADQWGQRRLAVRRERRSCPRTRRTRR